MERVNPEPFEAFISQLVESLGAPENISQKLASSLVESDLVGHSSHGSRLLPAKYAPEVDNGRIIPSATQSVERDDGVFVRIDGRKAFGQVVAREAVDKGVKKAEENGIGVVSLRNVSHIGRVGEWAERAVGSGMGFVGFVSNPGSQWVAPPGSAERRFSTNPVVAGMPTFDVVEFPFILDMATSQVARSKIREWTTAGDPLPEGWVIDDKGASVTDGTIFEGGDGAILPLGGLLTGHKGFGLAVMSELIAGCVSNGSVSGMDDVLWGNHAVFFVIDVEWLTTRDALESQVAAVVEHVRETDYSAEVPMPLTSYSDQALLPGEAEHRTRETNQKKGIPIPVDDISLLVELAEELDVHDAVPPALR